MANCALCGKKLGVADTISEEFKDIQHRCTCFNCHFKFINQIKPQIEKMKENEEDIEEIVDSIARIYSLSNESKQFIFDYIQSTFSGSEKRFYQEKKNELLEKAKNQKITTGYSFDGYRIISYKGVISGESVLGTGFISELLASASDFVGTESDSFSEKMRKVKESALTKLKVQSVQLGGNAIIGVDFDYINFSNNMIGVSANGTVVTIEKIGE